MFISGIAVLGLIFFLFYASVFVAAALLFVGIFAVLLKEKRVAYYCFGLTLGLGIFLGGFYWWVQPSPLQDYTVSFQVPPDFRLAGLPNGRTERGSNGVALHTIRGHLKIEITLPDGKKIQGAGEELKVTTQDSRIEQMELTYRPTTQMPLFEYWEDGGRNTGTLSEDHVEVERGMYSVELVRIKNDGYCLGYQLAVKAPAAL